MSSEIKFQVLHEHYLDTFQIIKDSIKLRDRLIALVILILAILVFYSFWPSNSITALSHVIEGKLGVLININPNFLGSIIWFSLLAVVIRYTQIVVYIERQYAYIHNIEEELSKNYNNKIVFTREGKNYLNKYPLYSDWICFLYTVIFPVILLSIVLLKIVNEWISWGCSFSFLLFLNTVTVLSIMITVVLYMIFMYKQK